MSTAGGLRQKREQLLFLFVNARSTTGERIDVEKVDVQIVALAPKELSWRIRIFTVSLISACGEGKHPSADSRSAKENRRWTVEIGNY
jgi:hypothetical protein